MQFIFDLIWMQSCSRYLAATGEREARQWSRRPQLFTTQLPLFAAHALEASGTG
jgi:hypothetical protein